MKLRNNFFLSTSPFFLRNKLNIIINSDSDSLFTKFYNKNNTDIHQLTAHLHEQNNTQMHIHTPA